MTLHADNLKKDFNQSDIRQLSFTESLITVLIELFRRPRKQERLAFPPLVGEFQFVKTVMEGRHHNRFEFALYSKDGITYFAKQLPLREYCLENYWFRREIKTLNILKSVINESAILKQAGIRIPIVVKTIEDNDRVLAIYEFINDAIAVEDAGMSDAEKVNIFNAAFNFMDNIERAMTPVQKKHISHRPLMYFGILFWPMLIKAIIRHPAKGNEIVSLAIKFVKNVACIFKNSDMSLVHRDLNPSNILISQGGDLYIIDFEVATVSNPLYTEVGLMTAAARRSSSLLAKCHQDLISRRAFISGRPKSVYVFLSVYACIHSLASIPDWRLDNNFTFLKYCQSL